MMTLLGTTNNRYILKKPPAMKWICINKIFLSIVKEVRFAKTS